MKTIPMVDWILKEDDTEEFSEFRLVEMLNVSKCMCDSENYRSIPMQRK
jgi:hypothetical protein